MFACIHQDVFSLNIKNWVKPIHGNNSSQQPPPFHWPPMQASPKTSNAVLARLAPKTNSSGIENDHSFGTWLGTWLNVMTIKCNFRIKFKCHLWLHCHPLIVCSAGSDPSGSRLEAHRDALLLDRVDFELGWTVGLLDPFLTTVPSWHGHTSLSPCFGTRTSFAFEASSMVPDAPRMQHIDRKDAWPPRGVSITWSTKWSSKSPVLRCFPVGKEVLHVSQKAVTFLEIAHHFPSKPDCRSNAEVPSFTLRTACSGKPFVSER